MFSRTFLTADNTVRSAQAQAWCAHRENMPMGSNAHVSSVQPNPRAKSPLKNRHLVWLLLILVLTHLSQLMAKNDDTLVTWSPPIEPPGSVVVTPSNRHAQPSRSEVQKSGPMKASALNAQQPPPPSGQSVANEAALRQALTQWSQAWSQQDLPQYLSKYASNFKAPNGLSRSAWAKQRTQRISGKKTIQHSLSDVRIQMSAQTATVRFTQSYQDERLRLVQPKTMLWAYKDGQWQITLENTD